MLRLRDIMTRDVLTVSPTTTLREAAELFATRHIGGAPVVEGPALLGVVSACDILAFAAAAGDGDASPDADDADWGAADGEDVPTACHFVERFDAFDGFDLAPPRAADPMDRRTVADVMTRRIIALPSSAGVADAAACLRDADVHRVMVVDDGRLAGIVTTTDVTRAVADRALERRTYVFPAAR
jgi:CBS domain-containing protein